MNPMPMNNTNMQPSPVIYQPQNQMMVNPFHDFNDQWSIGLCDCGHDLGQCCYAYWCYCCFLGSLAKDINESTASCCCLGNVLGVYRMKVRSILKIRGDSFQDGCVVCWCPCCAALQMRNEVKNRGLA